MQILIPPIDAQRRARAHKSEDGHARALCGKLYPDYDVATDSEATYALLRVRKRRMCGTCQAVVRSRRGWTPKPRPQLQPTRAELEAERLAAWQAAARLAQKSLGKYDADHVVDAAGRGRVETVLADGVESRTDNKRRAAKKGSTSGRCSVRPARTNRLPRSCQDIQRSE